MPVSTCYCGAQNHHTGTGFRVKCHACGCAFTIPQGDRRADS